MTSKDFITIAREQGFTTNQIKDALEDGEVLRRYNIDQTEAEEGHWALCENTDRTSTPIQTNPQPTTALVQIRGGLWRIPIKARYTFNGVPLILHRAILDDGLATTWVVSEETTGLRVSGQPQRTPEAARAKAEKNLTDYEEKVPALIERGRKYKETLDIVKEITL